MRLWKGWKLWLSKRELEKKVRSLAVGVNSTISIEDDIHVIFLDFDTNEFWKVKNSVRECQKFWNLADAYVYKTLHGFHAIFYEDQVPYERVLMIVNYIQKK